MIDSLTSACNKQKLSISQETFIKIVHRHNLRATWWRRRPPIGQERLYGLLFSPSPTMVQSAVASGCTLIVASPLLCCPSSCTPDLKLVNGLRDGTNPPIRLAPSPTSPAPLPLVPRFPPFLHCRPQYMPSGTVPVLVESSSVGRERAGTDVPL